jgi:DNA replication regulator DPB11
LDETDVGESLAPLRCSSPQPLDDSPDATLPPLSSQQSSHPPTVNPEEEEIAPVRKRVPHETLKLWGNLLGPRGFEVVDGKLKRTPSKSQASQSSEQVLLSPTKLKTQLVNTADSGSMLSNFKRTNSFAVKPKEETRRRPFTRVATVGTSAPMLALQRETGQPIASGSKLPAEQNRKGIFSRKKFRAIGEAKADNVKSVVEGEDGFWITDELEDVDFVIVRLVWLAFSLVLPDCPD